MIGSRDTISRVVSSLTRLATGAVARWAGSQPTTTQRIYFANHTSHLDTLVLWSLLPPHIRLMTRPVAAREYWNATGLRRFVAHEVFNAVLIERPDHAGSEASSQVTLASQAFSTMLEAMGGDCSLILFPEGTRGDGTAMRPFKSGLYHLARRKPGLEMIPVYLENLNRILPKGELLPVPLLVSVSFGPPLYLGEQESKISFLDRARCAIEELRV
jgi:1-acyl-sn-glycerol-3-phosphate acyltransferase